MRFSVFTPTHNTRWLGECYASLLAQTNQSWEWVVIPNATITPADVREVLTRTRANDDRVRVVSSPLKGVGALKRFAVEQCSGDVLVELDHDDTLTPDCLMQLDNAYLKQPDAFYYSDFVSAGPDGRCEVYTKYHGWTNYPFSFNDEEFVAMKAFEPTARSLCEIYYAPNHVRAWSRVAYARSGGHNPKIALGDDHDIVCRTYLAGVPFVYIPHCLYFYRVHSGSTCRVDNDKVRTQQKANMAHYLYALVYEECRRKNTKRLEIGPQPNRQGPGFEYMATATFIDKQMPRMPYATGSLGCIWLSDVLHRIPGSQLAATFNELHRVLAPGGWLLTKTPAIDDGEGKVGRGAFQDPRHVSYWSPNSFWYFTHKDYAQQQPDYTGRFQQVRSWVEYPTAWHRANYLPYVYADLVALKDQREAGLSTI